jgi:hypothetical protein
MIKIDELIATAPLYIVSGEGDLGTTELYTGKRTVRAIKARLTRERCGGDRWARCEAQVVTDWGVDFVTVEDMSHAHH